jgi:trigger factor
MKVTTTKGPRSSVVLEVEVPSERVARSVEQAVSRLSRSTRVPGFRPGRAPREVLERVVGPQRVLDEAFEHLIPDTLEEALDGAAVVPLTSPDVEVVQRDEGKPLIYRATMAVRPDVTLGEYRDFGFGIELEEIDDARVEQVLEELRDQQATLTEAQGRPVRDGDFAIIGFEGRRDGQTFEGGSAERYPLVVGSGRMIPGFEAQLVGVRAGAEKRFQVTFPADYPEQALAGQPVDFTVRVHEVREKVLPALDDDLARSLGDYADLTALRVTVRRRLEANARDRARHGFIDRIIEHAVATATLELPDALVDAEVDVMLEELEGRLSREGITLADYLAAVQPGPPEPVGGLILPDSARRTPTPAERLARLRADSRPRAEERAKILLVLNAVADAERFEVSDGDLEAELGRIRGRHPDDPRLVAYFESPRGRASLRASLRRSGVVERLVDEWLAAHPEAGPLPHLEDDEPAASKTS